MPQKLYESNLAKTATKLGQLLFFFFTCIHGCALFRSAVSLDKIEFDTRM